MTKRIKDTGKTQPLIVVTGDTEKKVTVEYVAKALNANIREDHQKEWDRQQEEIKKKIANMPFVTDEKVIDDYQNYELYIRMKHFVCGNHPISLHLAEDFVTPVWVIDLANQEIEHREVERTEPVKNLREAIEVLDESKIVYIDHHMNWHYKEK